MALKKSITSRAGVALEYWKIGSWYVDPTHKIMDINLIPYVSASTRSSGLEPVNEEVRKIRVYDRVDKLDAKRSDLKYSDNFSPAALESAKIDIYKLMYGYIKINIPEFSDAEDI